jgi:hypothetical protein
MKERPPSRPARSLFERAEITTRDVLSFAVVYGVLPLGFFFYVWWTNWGGNGTDAGLLKLKIIGGTWLFVFILYANGAIRQRLKKIARRDGITPEALIAQVEPPIQTNKERFILVAVFIVVAASCCYGVWWWKFARDGQVSQQDISFAKFALGMWLLMTLIIVIQGISGARNMRRQLEATRRPKEHEQKKRPKPIDREPAGPDRDASSKTER